MNDKKMFVAILGVATILMGAFVVKDVIQKNGIIIKGKNGWEWNNKWDELKDEGVVEPIPPENPNPQQQTQLIAKTYDEAIEISKKHQKNILIFFGADWCDYCNQMKSKTLESPAVKNDMVKYVFLIVDVDTESRLARKYKVQGLPTYVIATADEEIVKRGSGYKGEDAFSEWLR